MWAYSRIIDKINVKYGKVSHGLPQSAVKWLYPYYINYIKSLVSEKRLMYRFQVLMLFMTTDGLLH